MRLIYVFVASFILLGCSSTKVSIDNLQVKENRYYLQGKKPYTGKVISKFDNGSVASVIQIKNGIPDGKWVAYGYKGEIVQEGSYQPVNISEENMFKNNNFIRLNVCNTKEGAIEFTDVFVVTESIEPNVRDYKNEILAFLKSKSINIKGDSINEVKYVKAELDN